MRRLRVFLLNAFLLVIPFLAGAWLLTVKPAHAQYPGSGYPGSGYPGGTNGTNSFGGVNNDGLTDAPGLGPGGGLGTGGTGSGNTGYPGGNTGGSGTGGGTTGGSNTGYPGGGNTGGTGSGTDGTGTGGTGTGGPITPGHWDVTYSSQGTNSWDYPTDSSAVMSGSLPWPTTEAGSGVGNNYYLDASTTGTVTGTLTWVPTTGQDSTSDPPASSVIVTEAGYAAASGGGVGTATADDGWGDKSGQSGYPGGGSGGGGYPGDPSSAYSSGTHYEVKDGSSGSITVGPFTLSAATPDNTTPDANGNFPAMGAFVSASINFLPNAATISLLGTTTDTDGSKIALTGQGIAAHVDGAPANVSSYTWSFTGGTPIKNWDQSSSQTVALAPADLSQTDPGGNGIPVAPIGFYYPKEGSLTVTCTINFILPDGKASTMTVKSQKITYKKPTVNWQVDTPYNGLNSGFYYGYTTYDFGALELWGPIKITEPASFATGGVGTGCIVQIATLDRSFTRHAPQLGDPDTSYSRLTVSNNDGTITQVKAPTGLDVGFPYPFGYTQNGDKTFTGQADPNGKFTWKASDNGFAADDSHQPYYTRDVDAGGSNWYYSSAKDSFDTYVMYQPSSKDGQGTIYVPLQKLTWKWGGSTSLDASN